MKFIGGIIDWFCTHIGGTPLDSLTFTSNDIAIANTVFKYFAWFGICLSLVYFLLEINRKYAFESNDLTIKSMTLPFVKLGASIALLSQGATLISRLLSWGNALFQYAYDNFDTMALGSSDSTYSFENFYVNLGGTVADDGTVSGVGAALIEGMSLLNLICVIPFVVAMALVALICSVVWIYKAFMFKLEVAYRICMTPIGLADIYSGHNTNAIRWAKGFLALMFYGMAFIVVPRIGNQIAVGLVTTTIGDSSSTGIVWFMERTAFLIQLCIAPIAELGILSVIKQMTKEALG
jgi:hypothetical protein